MKVLLVVEDDADMRRLIGVVLSADPRIEIVGEAATASEAIAVARSTQVDLIILDHFIEGDVMGLQAAPTLKVLAPNAKILLFTSHDLSTEVQREPAIDAYLPKRKIGELLPTCRHLLGLDPAA